MPRESLSEKEHPRKAERHQEKKHSGNHQEAASPKCTFRKRETESSEGKSKDHIP